MGRGVFVNRGTADKAKRTAMTGETLRMIFPSGRKEEAGLPETVQDFLNAFNHCAYPELELPPSGC